MIRIVYNDEPYVYIPTEALWVDKNNRIVRSKDIRSELKEASFASGFIDINPIEPPPLIERHKKVPMRDIKQKNKINKKLKSSSAVSLNVKKEKE